MRTKLYQFQQEDVEQIERWKGKALVASEVGTGKTPIYLAYLERNMPAGRSAVVCCPAGIKYNWAKEVRKHLGIEVMVAEGTLAPMTVWKRPRIVVVNYDILEPWLPYLVRLQPFSVCLDEAVYCKNREAGRTIAAIRLVRGIPSVVVMTATPLVNKPVDLWTLLHMLDAREWGVYYSFAHRYCAPRKGYRGCWVFDGACNTDELHARLVAKHLIRRRKVDVMGELPQIIHNAISLAVSEESMKEYRTAERSLREWFGKYVRLEGGHLVGDVLGAQNKTTMLKQLVAGIKVDAVTRWVEDFLESGERLLLFCHHKLMVKALAKRFKGCAVVNGEVIGRKRQEEYDRFNQGGTALLVGNMDACGTGWSAKGCSNVAVAEYPWRPDTLLQCVGRCHGIERGVEGIPTTAHYLSANGTIEEYVCEKLLAKQGYADQVIDGVKDRGQLSVLEDVVKRLMKTA